MYTPVRLTADFSLKMIAVGRQWDNIISLLEVKTVNQESYIQQITFQE